MERLIVEEMYNYDRSNNILWAAKKFFGIPRRKTSQILGNIKKDRDNDA
jgi:hypothetical protein